MLFPKHHTIDRKSLTHFEVGVKVHTVRTDVSKIHREALRNVFLDFTIKGIRVSKS